MCACVKCLGIVGVYMCEVYRDCGCVVVWSAKGLWVCMYMCGVPRDCGCVDVRCVGCGCVHVWSA